MELVNDLVDLGLDVLGFMERCILLGSWWEVQEHFDLNCRIEDAIYTIWGIGRNYLDQHMDNIYISIMLTLKDMFKHFRLRTEYEDELCSSF